MKINWIDRKNIDFILPVFFCVVSIGLIYALINIIYIVYENHINNNLLLLISFIILSIFNLIIIGKYSKRISESTARYMLDDMQVKFIEIEKKYSNESYDKNNYEKEKYEVRQEADLMGVLDYISRNVNHLNILIIIVYFPIILTLMLLLRFSNVIINIENVSNLIIFGIIFEILVIIVFIFIIKSINSIRKTAKKNI